MPNYSYQSNAIFEPMSLERYIQPLAMYSQAYKEVADLYDILSNLSEMFRQRAEQEKDSQWAQRYMQYADGLKQAADELAADGLSQGLRGELRKYKRDYGNVIEPINKAVQRLAELLKIADAADPRMRMLYGQMPSILTLIDNPNASRVGYSLTDVEGEAAALAKASADRRLTAILEDIGNYIRTMQTQGYSQEEINAFMLNAANIPELQNIVGGVSDMYNNFDGLENAGKQQALNAIMNGILRGATYDQKVDYQTDLFDLENLRFRHNAALKSMSNSTQLSLPFSGSRSRSFLSDNSNGLAKKIYDNAVQLMQNGFDIRDYIYDKNGKFVNPLKESKGPAWSGGSSITGYTAMYNTGNNDGVPRNKDINKMLKAMGFSENDSEEKFLSLNDNFNDYLLGMVELYNYKAINILDNQELNKVFKEGVISGDNKRMKSMIHKVSNDWEDDGEISRKELQALQGKGLEVHDAYYGPGNTNKVIVTTNVGTFAVDPSLLGSEMSNMITSHGKDINQFRNNPLYAKDYVTTMNDYYVQTYGQPLYDDLSNKSDRWFVNQAIDFSVNSAVNDMGAWSNNFGQTKPKTSSKIE